MTATGCLACAGEEIARARTAGEEPDPSRVAPAVTWAPSAQVAQVLGKTAASIVPVPSCLAHLVPDSSVSKAGLVTA